MKSYLPEPLAPIVVNEIFEASLAVRTSQKIIKCILFQKEKGFPEDSNPVFFDAYALENQMDSIEYLLGQLKAVHENKKSITIKEACIRYDDSIWINEQRSLLQFLHLACAVGLLSPVDFKSYSLEFMKNIYPTLNTFDSNFFDWEKKHKPEILKLIEEENKG